MWWLEDFSKAAQSIIEWREKAREEETQVILDVSRSEEAGLASQAERWFLIQELPEVDLRGILMWDKIKRDKLIVEVWDNSRKEFTAEDVLTPTIVEEIEEEPQLETPIVVPVWTTPKVDDTEPWEAETPNEKQYIVWWEKWFSYAPWKWDFEKNPNESWEEFLWWKIRMETPINSEVRASKDATIPQPTLTSSRQENIIPLNNESASNNRELELILWRYITEYPGRVEQISAEIRTWVKSMLQKDAEEIWNEITWIILHKEFKQTWNVIDKYVSSILSAESWETISMDVGDWWVIEFDSKKDALLHLYQYKLTLKKIEELNLENDELLIEEIKGNDSLSLKLAVHWLSSLLVWYVVFSIWGSIRRWIWKAKYRIFQEGQRITATTRPEGGWDDQLKTLWEFTEYTQRREAIDLAKVVFQWNESASNKIWDSLYELFIDAKIENVRWGNIQEQSFWRNMYNIIHQRWVVAQGFDVVWKAYYFNSRESVLADLRNANTVRNEVLQYYTEWNWTTELKNLASYIELDHDVPNSKELEVRNSFNAVKTDILSWKLGFIFWLNIEQAKEAIRAELAEPILKWTGDSWEIRWRFDKTILLWEYASKIKIDNIISTEWSELERSEVSNYSFITDINQYDQIITARAIEARMNGEKYNPDEVRGQLQSFFASIWNQWNQNRYTYYSASSVIEKIVEGQSKKDAIQSSEAEKGENVRNRIQDTDYLAEKNAAYKEQVKQLIREQVSSISTDGELRKFETDVIDFLRWADWNFRSWFEDIWRSSERRIEEMKSSWEYPWSSSSNTNSRSSETTWDDADRSWEKSSSETEWQDLWRDASHESTWDTSDNAWTENQNWEAARTDRETAPWNEDLDSRSVWDIDIDELLDWVDGEEAQDTWEWHTPQERKPPTWSTGDSRGKAIEKASRVVEKVKEVWRWAIDTVANAVSRTERLPSEELNYITNPNSYEEAISARIIDAELDRVEYDWKAVRNTLVEYLDEIFESGTLWNNIETRESLLVIERILDEQSISEAKQEVRALSRSEKSKVKLWDIRELNSRVMENTLDKLNKAINEISTSHQLKYFSDLVEEFWYDKEWNPKTGWENIVNELQRYEIDILLSGEIDEDTSRWDRSPFDDERVWAVDASIDWDWLDLWEWNTPDFDEEDFRESIQRVIRDLWEWDIENPSYEWTLFENGELKLELRDIFETNMLRAILNEWWDFDSERMESFIEKAQNFESIDEFKTELGKEFSLPRVLDWDFLEKMLDTKFKYQARNLIERAYLASWKLPIWTEVKVSVSKWVVSYYIAKWETKFINPKEKSFADIDLLKRTLSRTLLWQADIPELKDINTTRWASIQTQPDKMRAFDALARFLNKAK